MQALITMSSQPRKRRPKSKKATNVVTYRLDPIVKTATAELADIFGRSENLQVEFGLKIAFLHAKGINVYGMSDLQIIDKLKSKNRKKVENFKIDKFKKLFSIWKQRNFF